jgi:hypothetical protein
VHLYPEPKQTAIVCGNLRHTTRRTVNACNSSSLGPKLISYFKRILLVAIREIQGTLSASELRKGTSCTTSVITANCTSKVISPVLFSAHTVIITRVRSTWLVTRTCNSLTRNLPKKFENVIKKMQTNYVTSSREWVSLL